MSKPAQPSKQSKVYMDTNVILEAHRTSCWRGMANFYDVQIVEEIDRELDKQNPADSRWIEVDMVKLRLCVAVHKVSQEMVAMIELASSRVGDIHPGERDLLAFARLDKSAWLLTAGDRGAVKAACALGMTERLRTLEGLASQAGIQPKLALNYHYTNKWLSEVKTEYLLESSLS